MSTPDEDEQNEEAQLKLEERLERGFEKVITEVLIGQPTPLAMAALRVVSGFMLICVLSNIPEGNERAELIDGYLEHLKSIGKYKPRHVYENSFYNPKFQRLGAPIRGGIQSEDLP
jgi:hypothetical protein